MKKKVEVLVAKYIAAAVVAHSLYYLLHVQCYFGFSFNFMEIHGDMNHFKLEMHMIGEIAWI